MGPQDLLDGSAAAPSQGAAPAASEGFMDLFGGGTTAQAQTCAPMVTWQELEGGGKGTNEKMSTLTRVFAGKCVHLCIL